LRDSFCPTDVAVKSIVVVDVLPVVEFDVLDVDVLVLFEEPGVVDVVAFAFVVWVPPFDCVEGPCAEAD
jgi:hypothetical protein